MLPDVRVGGGAGEHLAAGVPDDLEVEVVLGREVVEQEAAGDTRLIGDVLDGDLLQRALRQHLGTEIDQLRAPLFGAETGPLHDVHETRLLNEGQ